MLSIVFSEIECLSFLYARLYCISNVSLGYLLEKKRCQNGPVKLTQSGENNSIIFILWLYAFIGSSTCDGEPIF